MPSSPRARTLLVAVVAACAIAVGAGLALGWRGTPPAPASVALTLPERTAPTTAAGARPGEGEGTAALPTVAPGGALVAPAVPPSAFAHVPEATPGAPLAPAPDPALVEVKPFGHLPRVGVDGRLPRQVYARPFDQRDDRPRVAIVVTGLGLSTAATDGALPRLPPAATLAFDAHGAEIERQVSAARRDGHEVLLAVPAEAGEPPFADAGGDALLSSLPPAANLERLERFLARVPGYVGVAAPLAGRIGTDKASLAAIDAALAQRGLLLLDTSGEGAAPLAVTTPLARVDLVIDAQPTAEAIDSRLRALETLARQRLAAVGAMQATPLAVARLRAWSDTLAERGVVLAPVSAVAGRQME